MSDELKLAERCEHAAKFDTPVDPRGLLLECAAFLRRASEGHGREELEARIVAAESGATINDVLANYRAIRRSIQDRMTADEPADVPEGQGAAVTGGEE